MKTQITKRERARIAAEFGRMGGESKSPAKAAAARKNGKKGGWPKGKRRKAGVEKMAARFRAAVEHAQRQRASGGSPKDNRTVITIDSAPPRKVKGTR